MTMSKEARSSAMHARSRAIGAAFETHIDASLIWYEQQKIAAVKKTPEPMKVIRPLAGAQFVACFTKKAQPDYTGTIRGGRAVRFDAKATSKGRIERRSVTDEQERELNAHYALGADCFILCSYTLTHVYRVPWVNFRAMKEKLGHLYVTEEEMTRLGGERLSLKDGIIHIFAREERETLWNE